MNERVFYGVMGVGLMTIAVGGFPFEVIAQSKSSEPLSNSDLTTQQAQMPEAEDRPATVNLIDDSPETLPEGTLVFSQNDQLALRVYNEEGTLRLNLYNKQTGNTELRGASVTVEVSDMGVSYHHPGVLTTEPTVNVAIAHSGQQTIIIDNAQQQTSSAITGTVSYLPRIALPPNAAVEVSLVDVSRADAPAITLASTQVVSGGRQVPIPFELLYDAGQIDSRFAYAVQSRITVDGDLQFINTTRFPVITNGSPTEGVAIQVDPVAGN